jgi:phosphatidylglycerol:prolipoprotein diacylglycerol transferase
LYIPTYGAVSALGALLALFLAQRTARTTGVNAAHLWNLCVVGLFAALAGQRLLLIAINWGDLRRNPGWMLGLAMIHHPLLAGAGVLAGAAAAVLCARWQRMPLAATADALAAPLALGLAFEQLGALMSGSGYGTETSLRWAVTYNDIFAARWSGTPLGVPLHPVQAYTALAFLTLSIFLLVWLPAQRRQGDVAGLWLLGAGVSIYITELWRDTEGRGTLLNGALDGPQAAAILLVLTGAILLLERKRSDAEMERKRTGAGNEATHG